MKLIDFDGKLAKYIEEHANYSAIDGLSEEKMAEELDKMAFTLYEDFMDEPKEWLSGKKPSEYFDGFNNDEIVDMYIEYFKQFGSPPDLLVAKMVQIGVPLEEKLFSFVKNAKSSENLRMTSMGILDDMGSRLPMEFCINLQVNRKKHDDLADFAMEVLKYMPQDEIGPKMLKVFEISNDEGKDAMLDILAKPNCDEMVFKYVLNTFSTAEDKELYAHYLSKIGDERALPALLEAAQFANYVDWLEIRLAIENLGGKCPKRDFKNDPMYRELHK